MLANATCLWYNRIMDFVFDIIFGALLELFKIICPDHKFKKWQEILLIVLSVIILISSIGCFVAGVCLFNNDAHKTLGIALLAVGGSLLLIQGGIYGGLIGYRLKADARKKNEYNAEDKNANE